MSHHQAHPHSVHHVLNHQHAGQQQPQYIHYTGPPSSSNTDPSASSSSTSHNLDNNNAGTNNSNASSSSRTPRPTTTTPQSVLNNALSSSSSAPQPSSSSSSSMSTLTMTVAPQDTTTTKFVHHYAVPSVPYQYHHYQPAQLAHANSDRTGSTNGNGNITSNSDAAANTIVPAATSKTPVPLAVSTSVIPSSSNSGISTSTTAASANGSGSAGSSAGAGTGSTAPLVATGDWTRDLVHLAKTAELKKHALTLQLHTAHILSAHAALEQKSKSIQDVKEQRNKLESERTRLLTALRQVNEDRDKADLLEGDLERESTTLRHQILALSDGEYAVAKADVDRLRAELGQPALPSLQTMLDEKASTYLTERRLNGNGNASSHVASTSPAAPSAIPTATPTSFRNTFPPPSSTPSSAPASSSTNPNKKRPASSSIDASSSGGNSNGFDAIPAIPAKRPRGRPKGSKAQKRTT
ncbi:hypothetical protein C8J55DRAFT_45529 [Lentinula edodes]|uniref:Uncharacterized protein n=1 Tax=Lentinula lateritia TaxID=40482 RepID=A0A9W9DS81_9AGAR|nr:hypothetical protein C8J55DRAFT_45529 [Lentinula edodes]